MKPLIDWVLIFFLLFILNAIAAEFLFGLERRPWKKLDIELDIKDRGVMYYFPVTRG